MSRIFDKDRPEYKVYEPALRYAETHGSDDLRAIAINLRCDHRVMERREEQFRTLFDGDLETSIKRYFEQRINILDPPDYCQSWCNNLVANCVTPGGSCCEGFDVTITLSTVVNLNSFQKILHTADQDFEILSYVPGWQDLRDLFITDALTNPSEFSEWLDDQFLGEPANSPKIEGIIKEFFNAINFELVERRDFYKPAIWVTDWNLFKEYTHERRLDGRVNVDRWNQVLGVNRPFRVWQIVIKYPVADLNCLYRPTQLDAEYYPQHFPPPRNAEFCLGGHAIDLHPAGIPLLPEYIHRQIFLKPEYWTDDKLIGKTEITYYELATPRQRHYENLEREYDPLDLGLVRSWMDRAI